MPLPETWFRQARVGVVMLVIACAGAAGCQSSTPSAQTSAVPSPPAVSIAASIAATPGPHFIGGQGMKLVGSLPGTMGDIAFWGDRAVATVWLDIRTPSPDAGFLIIDLADPTSPKELGRFRCIESNADISIWDTLVVVSQDHPSRGDACDAPSVEIGDPGAFAGVRIVSIADPTAPVQVAAVPTGVDTTGSSEIVRGSHTNTLLPDLDHLDAAGKPAPRLIVYAAMYYYPSSRPHLSIVEIPLDDPAAAQVVGTLDNGTFIGCHEATVFTARNLLACAAYEAGVVLFDISDPIHPVIVSHLVDPELTRFGNSHHSTVFSNDGRTLVVNAEIYTDVGKTPCAGGSSTPNGGVTFYDITDATMPERRGFFQLPRTSSAEHFCYAHQSGIVPLDGPRNVLVTGWFGGGVNLVDFTDPSAPAELAWWTSSLPDGEHAFPYTAYWYNGLIYAPNTALEGIDVPSTRRGLDVLAVDDPSLAGALALPYLNPQTQGAQPGS